MQIIPGPTGREISREVAEQLNVEEVIPEYKSFPDGETYLRLPEKLDDDILVIQSCHNPQDTNLFQLLNLVSTIKRLGNSKVTVYVPYMCYARADRDVLGGEAISIRTVLNLLETVGVDHLITLDIHNPEVFEYASAMRTTNIFASRSMKNYLKQYVRNVEDLQVFAPDAGAIKRARLLAEEMDVEYDHLEKKRDPHTGEVNIEMGAADIVKKEIVIVDDIISTGSTLVEASTLLRINGAERIHYLLSHALGTDAVDKLQEIGNGIVAATNSVPNLLGKISSTEDLIQVI